MIKQRTGKIQEWNIYMVSLKNISIELWENKHVKIMLN